ncbi:MAG: exodeoxyribonuclease VII large subunit [Bacteroidia bacterium]|jgi:exodeoxyribonuclease VII large subunit
MAKDPKPASPGLFDQMLAGEAPKKEQPAKASTLSVTEATARIKTALTGVGGMAVEGEMTRATKAASGHIYFTLKDAGASISCILWKGKVETATKGLRPKEGDKVIVRGKLDVYAPRGGYSLIVDSIEPVGIGQELLKLEKLKAELREKGWFDRRREIPAMPNCIGVVTSRDAAALRDFLRTRTLRWAGYPVRLCHTPVQGPAAAKQIAKAIDTLSNSGVDVVVVTRGGGSLEDLWCFNERVVAEAIWRSPVPVVVGVGHESDTTLADFVGDHRAHTPTDAAQIVFPDRAALTERIERVAGYLDRAVEDHLERRTRRLDACATSRVLANPSWILGDRERSLGALLRRSNLATKGYLERASSGVASLEGRIDRASPVARLSVDSERVNVLGKRLLRQANLLPEQAERRMQFLARSLDAVSPLRVLGRGYSITTSKGGKAVRQAAQVAVGDTIETRVAAGQLVSKVTKVVPAAEGEESS